MAIKIEILECRAGGAVFTYTARTDEVREALARALKKYGRGPVFVKDRSISIGASALEGPQYGQIGSRCGTGVSLSTGRVRISATRI